MEGLVICGGCGRGTEACLCPSAPRARHSDPPTSHAAAASVRNLTAKQAAVLEVIRGSFLPISDEKLIELYDREARFMRAPPQSDSGIRTRRAELVDAGLVVNDGAGKTVSGRACALWRTASSAPTQQEASETAGLFDNTTERTTRSAIYDD